MTFRSCSIYEKDICTNCVTRAITTQPEKAVKGKLTKRNKDIINTSRFRSSQGNVSATFSKFRAETYAGARPAAVVKVTSQTAGRYQNLT